MKMAIFWIILLCMARYGPETSFIPIFSARDDLAKVSWNSDSSKYEDQVTTPFFDQLSERCQLLYELKR